MLYTSTIFQTSEIYLRHIIDILVNANQYLNICADLQIDYLILLEYRELI